MKTRRFIVYSIIYTALIALAVYMQTDASYELNLLGYKFSMPIAAWFALPIAIFALLAVLHIFYHSFSVYQYKKNIKRDSGLFLEMVKEIFLGLASNKEFKTELFSTPVSVTRVLSPWGLYREFSVADENIASIINIVRAVKNGEVMDLKKFKLPKDNPLFIKNEQNKVLTQGNYYIDVLKDATTPAEISSIARNKLIQTGDFSDIKRYVGKLSADEAMSLLERYVNDNISMGFDEIFDLLNDDKISRTQYLKSAIMLKNKLKPDTYKAIFEKLRSSHADADEAYAYVLYELVLLDDLRDMIEGSDTDEFQEIKTLLFLRDHSKNVSSSLFFK